MDPLQYLLRSLISLFFLRQRCAIAECRRPAACPPTACRPTAPDLDPSNPRISPLLLLLCNMCCRVRGYLIEKRATKTIEVTEPGDWIIGVDGDATQVNTTKKGNNR